MDNKRIYYGWWIVLTGFLVMALVYAALVSCQGLFIKPVTEELGFSRTGFSATTTILSLGLILGSSFMGSLVSKISIKKVMIICCAIVAACLFGFSISKSLWQFYALGATMGIAFAGAATIPISILINNWFGSKKKGLAMSLAFAGSGIGGMLLTMVLNNIIQNYGWRSAYVINCIIILAVVCPMIFFIVKKGPEEKGLTRLGETSEEKSTKVKTGISMAEAKKTSVFWMIFISFLLSGLLNSGLLNHQIPYLSDIGFNESKSASIGALAIGSLALGKIILGSLCDKLGLKTGSLLANMMFTLALVALFITAQIEFGAYVYIVMFCVGGAVTTICLPLFVGKVFGEKDYGSLVGIMNVAVGVGIALGSVICGKIYDATGSYKFAWMIFIVGSVLIILMQLFSLTRKVNISKEKPSNIKGVEGSSF